MTANFLSQALGQSEHLYGLIQQSAEELSSANMCIRHGLANRNPLLEIETAVTEIEVIAIKLQRASEVLAATNQGLRIEIRDRIMLDYQWAAAVEQEEGSRKAALHDTLTGLPNRALFSDRLEHGIAQAKRHRRMLAVMFVDLNNFKGINDTYGHQAGDAVLRTVAMRLKETMRKDDTVSRHGGDEFLCLLTQLHEEKDIAKIAEKISNAIQGPCKVSIGDVVVNPCLEASIGISAFPRDGSNARALISAADEAMYRAKENKLGYAFAQ